MATVSRGRTSERFKFIQRNQEEFSVSYLCDWLKVSRSGYYDWASRFESERSLKNSQLLKQILAIYEASRGNYGSPRVYEHLKANGVCVSRKRVERLMRMHGLKGRVARVTRRQPGLKRFYARGENLRLNCPPPREANQVWVADITFLKMRSQWMYLAAIMDVHSRRIIGWSLSKNRTIDLTLTALRYALKDRELMQGTIFHTDRGVEYTGRRYQEQLKKYGLISSLNRAGHCTDNAHMKSFFHSLKAELIRGRQYNTEQELRSALKSYINYFYNTKRLHSGIGYQSPMMFEQALQLN